MSSTLLDPQSAWWIVYELIFDRSATRVAAVMSEDAPTAYGAAFANIPYG